MLERVSFQACNGTLPTKIWILGLVVTLTTSLVNTAKYRVVQLTEYSRNGARTVKTNSSRTILTPTKEFGVNMLTPNGYRMQYLLGLYVRKHYPEIFGTGTQTLGLKDIGIYTSSSQVSQQSAYSQFLGLLPLGSGPNITLPEDSAYTRLSYENMTSKIEGQAALPLGLNPVFLYQQTQDFDLFFLSDFSKSCPRAHSLVEGYKPGVYKVYQNLLQNMRNRLVELGFKSDEYASEPDWNFPAISKFTDEQIAYQSYTGIILSPLTPTDLDSLLLLSSLKTSLDFKDSSTLRLHADSVARQVLTGMKAAIENPANATKFRLFIGNQVSLFSHLELFGLSSTACLLSKLRDEEAPDCQNYPDFASHFLYELVVPSEAGLQETLSPADYSVRVMYNGRVIRFCSGKEYCPYKEFSKAYEKLFFLDPKDFLELCGNEYALNKAKSDIGQIFKPASVLISILAGSVLVMCSAYLLFKEYSRADLVLPSSSAPSSVISLSVKEESLSMSMRLDQTIIDT